MIDSDKKKCVWLLGRIYSSKNILAWVQLQAMSFVQYFPKDKQLNILAFIEKPPHVTADSALFFSCVELDIYFKADAFTVSDVFIE